MPPTGPRRRPSPVAVATPDDPLPGRPASGRDPDPLTR
ncbi:hypothetical protein SAMN04488543_2303 [Friedmanniella luteola]|uniref:Uncharacterized protein n=1 Tax=Friedmanniella luteola TaxID=546871 RepID=A0A1H1UR74_9ACTN|nr:hypothetical protein SAMN04488543_2303 [Friedmanniella luteola]